MSDWLEYHEEPVPLHSGGKSHWLVRGDLLYANEPLREAVLDYFEHSVRLWRPPWRIVSIPTGGDVWAAALRERIAADNAGDEIPFTFVVDDVATTGESLINAMAEENAHTALVVVDRRPARLRYNPTASSWATIPLPVEDPR